VPNQPITQFALSFYYGGETAGPELVQSPPSRTKFKNEWNCTSAFHMHLRAVGMETYLGTFTCSFVRNEIFCIGDIYLAALI
jgi:hypothetical protein